MNTGLPRGEEPTRWLIVFRRTADTWWIKWLVPGEFKHVCAYAFLPGAKVWLIFDVNMQRTAPIVIRDGGELPWLMGLIEDAEVISMARQEGKKSLPLFGWCVPAIAHLLGLRTWALRPDALYHYCRRNGGIPMFGDRREPFEAVPYKFVV